MTQDEIIEMAIEAGFFVKDREAYSPSIQEDHEITPFLRTFAKLVAVKEREWVGLTDDEIAQAIESINMLHGDYATEVAYAIEAKIKDKNS